MIFGKALQREVRDGFAVTQHDASLEVHAEGGAAGVHPEDIDGEHKGGRLCTVLLGDGAGSTPRPFRSGRQQLSPFDEPAELFFGRLEMLARLGLEVGHVLVLHGKTLQVDDPDVALPLFPNLTLM